MTNGRRMALIGRGRRRPHVILRFFRFDVPLWIYDWKRKEELPNHIFYFRIYFCDLKNLLDFSTRHVQIFFRCPSVLLLWRQEREREPIVGFQWLYSFLFKYIVLVFFLFYKLLHILNFFRVNLIKLPIHRSKDESINRSIERQISSPTICILWRHDHDELRWKYRHTVENGNMKILRRKTYIMFFKVIKLLYFVFI